MLDWRHLAAEPYELIVPKPSDVDPDPVGSGFIWVHGSGSGFRIRIRIRIQRYQITDKMKEKAEFNQ